METYKGIWLPRLGRATIFACAIWASAGLCANAEEKPLERITFGSCMQQGWPHPIWDAVIARRPQRFVFLGDNIYGDSDDMEVLKRKYAQLGAQEGFRRLRKQCPILAVWDDHDYGVNDGGAEFSQKAASQRVFNDFFDVPADSPRRKRPGIYDAVIVGPLGKRVQFLLLDTRYFRSPLKRWPEGKRRTPGPYAPNRDPQATMLGETQWQWLSEQLDKPAEVRIIASSIQFVPEQHGWEMWANFPLERQRMLRLLRDKGVGGVIVVSGDRHLAEISRLPADDAHLAYPLYDVTSSSLNSPSGGGNEGEPNRHRVSDQYLKENFGSITIDWSENPTIQLAVHDIEGQRVLAKKVSLSNLAPKRQPQ